MLYLMAQQKFDECEDFPFLVCPSAQPRFGVAGEDKCHEIKDPFMDLDDPPLILFGDKARDTDLVLRVLQTLDDKAFGCPCYQGGIGPPSVSEIGKDPSTGHGFQYAEHVVDAFRLRNRERFKEIMVEFHGKHD